MRKMAPFCGSITLIEVSHKLPRHNQSLKCPRAESRTERNQNVFRSGPIDDEQLSNDVRTKVASFHQLYYKNAWHCGASLSKCMHRILSTAGCSCDCRICGSKTPWLWVTKKKTTQELWVMIAVQSSTHITHGLSARWTLAQHYRYSTGLLKYRWHRQMNSLLLAAVLCGHPHHCSYWRDRSMNGLRPCYDCSWLVSWPLYPDWKECA